MSKPPRRASRTPDQIIRACRKWRDFEVALAPLGDKAKGDAFERLVQLYLQLDPRYRTRLRQVWIYDEVPARVRRHLRLPPRDKGIDLIAETREGGYWAIQAKYRTDRRRRLPFRELSTFAALAFTTCRNVEHGLICTTTDRVARELEGLPDRVSFRTSEVWYALDEEFFRQARAQLRGATPRPKRSRPRRHQRRAIKRAADHFQKQRQTRGKLIHPCGTGKTLTSYWIAQRLGARTILVAVPSLVLINQTLRGWLQEIVAEGKDRSTAWLCVCSDETAGAKLDELTAYTHDLGVPCVTKPAAIRRWFEQHKRGTRIVFTTYQSGKPLADAARRAGVSFDLGIFDEAHKTVGAKHKVFAHADRTSGHEHR